MTFDNNKNGPKIGSCAPFFFGEGAGPPYNTMWLGPRPTFIPSGILIHRAICPPKTSAEKWALLCPFLGGELGPHLTQCCLGWGLPPYQLASWSVQSFGHNAHGSKIRGAVPLGEESWVPTWNNVARAEAYVHAKFHLDTSNGLAKTHQFSKLSMAVAIRFGKRTSPYIRND